MLKNVDEFLICRLYVVIWALVVGIFLYILCRPIKANSYPT